MKAIFDFDDTIFDAKRFKNEALFTAFLSQKNEYAKVTSKQVAKAYKEFRSQNDIFYINIFIDFVIKRLDLKEVDKELVMFAMSSKIERFVKEEYLSIFKKIGKANIFVLSKGEYNFQMFKISLANIIDKVDSIKIVQGSKIDVILNHCNAWSPEEVIFVDDKVENFLLSEAPQNLRQIFVGNYIKLSNSEKEILKKFNISICEKDSHLDKYFISSDFEKIRIA